MRVVSIRTQNYSRFNVSALYIIITLNFEQDFDQNKIILIMIIVTRTINAGTTLIRIRVIVVLMCIYFFIKFWGLSKMTKSTFNNFVLFIQNLGELRQLELSYSHFNASEPYTYFILKFCGYSFDKKKRKKILCYND